MCLYKKHFLEGGTMQNLPTIFRLCSKCVCVGNIFLKVWPFRIYPPPSEFTHHLQKKSVLGPLDLFVHFLNLLMIPKNMFKGWYFPNFPNIFRFVPTLSDFFNIFRIHPPPSEKIGFGTSGPFWTFILKSQDPENVGFGKNDFFGRKLWITRKAMSLVLI